MNSVTTIPKEWQKLMLSNVSIKLKTGGTPSSSNRDFYNGDIPFVKIDDMTTSGHYILKTKTHISENALKNSSAWVVPTDSILYSIYATIGEVAINKVDLATNQAIVGIIPDNNKVNRDFLYYFLISIKPSLSRFFKETTQKNLTSEIVRKLEVLVPPLPEQNKIAEILSSVDEEIEKVGKEIKKIEEFKRGLMAELLTKGIGHKKFKKTKLGMIPEEWEAIKLQNSGIDLLDGDRGINYPKQEEFYTNEYCLFLSNKNIKNDRFVFEECMFITKEKDELLRKGKLQRNDIVLTTRGTVGNVAYYNDSVPYENIRINSGMLILRHGKKFDSLFLYKLLSSQIMKRKYKDMGSGSAQPQLPISSLKNINIPLIPLDEQKKIAKIISDIDSKINVNKQVKNKLAELKRGLMQDLLSGRARVI